MKRWTALMMLLFLLCPFLIGTAYASQAEYVDDMSRLDTNTTKRYYNLKAGVGSWAGTKDKDFLSVDNTYAGTGGVVYSVQGAKNIVASIYSNTGTEVSVDKQGNYILGNASLNGASSTGLKSLFSLSSKQAYVVEGKSAHVLKYDTQLGYIFVLDENAPNDLIPYGVSISVSSDGESYRSLSQVRVGYTYYQSASRVWEEWTASVPENANYIRVEINDTPFIESKDGSTSYTKSAIITNTLAEVRISGDNLIFGEREPIIEESVITSSPEPEAESKSENSFKSSKSTGGAGAAEGGGTGETSKSDSSQASSKFEGVIPEESKSSGGTKSEGGKTTSSSKTPKAEKSEESEVKEEELRKEQYLVTAAPKERDGFTALVIIYIVVVLAFIIFLLIKPKK